MWTWVCDWDDKTDSGVVHAYRTIGEEVVYVRGVCTADNKPRMGALLTDLARITVEYDSKLNS